MPLNKKEGATAAEEDKFHRELDKLVHKTFGHSSDEKKKMKEEVDQKQADIYAYQFMQYFNKMRRVVAHNFGDDTRKEFEKLVQYKFSEHNINEEAKPDFLDLDKDGDINQVQAVAHDPNKDDIPSIQITLTDTPEDPGNSPEGEFRISALYHGGSNGKMAILKDNPTLQKAVMALLQKEFQNTFRRVIHGVLGEPFGLKEEAKPDFLDLDNDGDKKEPMKKAAKDAKKEAIEKVMKKLKEADDTQLEKTAKDLEIKAEKAKIKAAQEKIANINKGVTEQQLNEGRNYDYEGKMAHSQLLSIVKNARDLFNMIDQDSQLKSWVQSKLTKAEDYLDSVRTYLEGESLGSTAPAMFENEAIKDETGVALSIGDVVKGGDGKMYQIIYSYSEGVPMMVPFDLKRKKTTSLRDKIYFSDQDTTVNKKLSKVLDFSATKGGFMK